MPPKSSEKKATSTPESGKSKSADTKDADPASEARKRIQSANYFKFKSRAGPQHLGSKQIPVGADGCLNGLTFVQSGVLDSFESEDIKKAVEKYGGRMTSAVSRKTSYLLLGNEPGEGKTKKAKELKVPTISEDGLLDLIRKSNPNAEELKQPDFFGVGDDDDEDKDAAQKYFGVGGENDGDEEEAHGEDSDSEDDVKPSKPKKRTKGDDVVSKGKKSRKN